MSGLEPLVALGLACNIFQLVEYGCSTIKLAKSIYQSSSPVVDKALQENALALSTISGEIKAAQRPANPSRLDKQLLATIDECYSAARDLQEEVSFLLGNAKQHQLAATLKVVAKTTWRKRRLDRLKQSLENAETLMRNTLLAQIWSRTHAAELDLNNVKDDLRAFIQKYRSGSTDIKQLVFKESLITRQHISSSSKETLEAIGGVRKQVKKLALEADVHVDRAQRERLLQSLKFPAFNERRNQVSEAHRSTFEWIFIGDDGPSQEDLAESDLEDSDWEDPDLEDLDLADPSEASWDLFSNWLSSTADIYWISGKPGSGKTTLVKYVLNHPKTATYLNTWSPRTLIISHFFWRPGTPIQQNIKGLLCSLLYQLLQNSVTATNYVLQKTQATNSGMKEADTDWSVPELRSVFLEILSSYERQICMFIDGLDEVHPSDGPMNLLDLLDEFTRYRNVKLCLSSRPEPILVKRLAAYSRLRLQDLTRSDLERYARDHTKSTESIYDEARRTNSNTHGDPIELLVDKAEGVFLWLVLAIRSINKGSTYGDTGAMIRQRIETLPGDLTKLYQDMWDRACEDNPLAYRQISALYFRLLLLSQGGPGRNASFASSLLHLMLASTSVADLLLEAIDNPFGLMPEEMLLQNCRAVERALNLYCFGLIETSESRDRQSVRVMGWYGSRYGTLWSLYGRKRLHFIHRTAQDFLLNTVDGAEILKHDSTTETSLFFAWTRAQLAISQLYADADSSNAGISSGASEYINLFDQYPIGVLCSEDPDRARAISYFEKLCNSGQLLSHTVHGQRFCGGRDFLKAAAIIHDEYLLPRPRIGSFSTATMSEILLNVLEVPPGGHHAAPSKYSAEPLITTLLSEGADPNWRGATFGSGEWSPFGFADARTPFTMYLTTTMNVKRWRGDQISRVIRNLHQFLSLSADLGDTIHHLFPYKFSGISVSPVQRFWSLGMTLSDWNYCRGLES